MGGGGHHSQTREEGGGGGHHSQTREEGVCVCKREGGGGSIARLKRKGCVYMCVCVCVGGGGVP